MVLSIRNETAKYNTENASLLIDGIKWFKIVSTVY